MDTEGTTISVSARKRQAIQAAGQDLFLRLGYDAASMDLIASEAGVAKQTVYSHFHSKEALFRAIVEDLASHLVSSLTANAHAQSDPAQVLTLFARKFLALMLEPSSLALHRVLVGEGSRFPELTREVYQAGPAHAVKMLSRYLASETDKGRLAVAETDLAAEQFLGMLTGLIQLRALFGIPERLSAADLEKAVAQAVQTFLTAYTPCPSGGATQS